MATSPMMVTFTTVGVAHAGHRTEGLLVDRPTLSCAARRTCRLKVICTPSKPSANSGMNVSCRFQAATAINGDI